MVAEEVSIYGGLGSTIARVVAEGENLVPLRVVAVRDMYLSSGDPKDLMDIAGLNVDGVYSAAQDVLARRAKTVAVTG